MSIKPAFKSADHLSENQSVVCLIGKEELPDWLKLSDNEKDFVLNMLKEKDDKVQVNSYNRWIYIVRLKNDADHYRVREDLRRQASNLKELIKNNNHTELAITSFNTYKEAVEDFAEGLALSIYSFDKYKTVKDDKAVKNYPSVLYLVGDISSYELKWLDDLTDAVYFTRDLINEPVNHLNAASLSEEIRGLGDNAGFKVEILEKGKIETLKMGGLLAVNRGSVDPPFFSILEWNPQNHVNKNPVVLVGKGVVYDTGGLNLKTGDYMAGMNGDMAGAATVAGVMYTIARSQIPLHVIGLVPSTDNRPGGNAYVQGDIITMHNQMTVEIGNTDAEGRLILADAICYASRYAPELIIDIATLTGSAAMTFSNQAIALMTNADRKYINLLIETGYEVYERLGELPFWDEYGELLKSDVADINNVGGREAGAIIAGKFLEKFAEYPLIHLDIAGTSMLKKDDYYRTKSNSGSGLRLLANFLRKLSENYNHLK